MDKDTIIGNDSQQQAKDLQERFRGAIVGGAGQSSAGSGAGQSSAGSNPTPYPPLYGGAPTPNGAPITPSPSEERIRLLRECKRFVPKHLRLEIMKCLDDAP